MMNGHESYLVKIMIKVMIMVTIKINDEFRNTGVYIRRKDSLMSSIRTINSCSLLHYHSEWKTDQKLKITGVQNAWVKAKSNKYPYFCLSK